MAANFFKIRNGVNVGVLTADPSGGTTGDVYYNSTTSKLREFINGSWRDAVTADDTQTLSNKTLDNTTVETIKDSNLTVQNATDTTKQVKLDLSAVSTGTTRTLAVPDVSSSLLARTSTDQGANRVQNKDLDASNTKIVDNTDTTKKIAFSASAASTGTTLTLADNQTTTQSLAVPNVSSGDTLVTNNTTATLASKQVQYSSSNDATATGSVATLTAFTTGIVRLTNVSLVSVSAIPAGSTGQNLIVTNQTGTTVTINNEDASVTAANRIRTGTGGPVSMSNNASFQFSYDSASSRWDIVGGTGSGSGSGAKNYLSAVTTSQSNTPNTGNGNFELGSTTGWSLAHTALTSLFPTSLASATVPFDSTHGGSAATAIALNAQASTTLTPTATWASGTNVITVSSGTSIAVGQVVTNPGAGTGFPTGTIFVQAVAGTSISLSKPTTGLQNTASAMSFTFLPLSGSYSASLSTASGTANLSSTAGDMVISSAFNIDNSSKNNVLAFSFSYQNQSGAALSFAGTSANSFAVYIYDVTSGAWIQPTGVYNMVQSSGIGTCTGSFQTNGTSTQYQIALININATSSLSYNLYLDDLAVGPGAISGTTAAANTVTTLSSGTSGTYTPPAGVYQIKVKVQAPGGGGAGAPGTSGTQSSSGGGGSGGGYCEKIINLATVGATSFSYTVGSGGTGGVGTGGGNTPTNNTTFSGGSVSMTATKGNGGAAGVAETGSVSLYTSGASSGGAASGGDLNVPGGEGQPGVYFTTGQVTGGSGGSSFLTGAAANSQGTQVGPSANGFGGGGSGAANAASQSGNTGGTGGNGVIVIEEIYGTSNGSGGNAIGVNGTIAFNATGTSTSITTASTVLSWNSKNTDTNSGFNGTTTYTVPMSGIYDLRGYGEFVIPSSAVGTATASMQLKRNGNVINSASTSMDSAFGTGNLSPVNCEMGGFQLTAGDLITVFANTNNAEPATTMTNAVFSVVLSGTGIQATQSRVLIPSTQQVLTTGTTYTRPSGPTPLFLKVTVIGGGGGSGGTASVASAGTASGGGGGGGTAIAWINNPLPTYPYTIGSGGLAGASGANAGGNGTASTFNTTISGGGGIGGNGGTSQGATLPCAGGGGGGGASGGTINIQGGTGGAGIGYVANGFAGGYGGSTLLAGQAAGSVIGGTGTGVGSAGQQYGGGAGGGGASGTQSAHGGAAGAAGVIVVEEFYQ